MMHLVLKEQLHFPNAMFVEKVFLFAKISPNAHLTQFIIMHITYVFSHNNSYLISANSKVIIVQVHVSIHNQIQIKYVYINMFNCYSS